MGGDSLEIRGAGKVAASTGITRAERTAPHHASTEGETDGGTWQFASLSDAASSYIDQPGLEVQTFR